MTASNHQRGGRNQQRISPLARIKTDLVYGFVLAGVFLLLYRCLLGESGLLKRISYGWLAWFFRMVMYAASQWTMFTIRVETLLYSPLTGLGEMLILGVLYGLTLKPLM